MGHEAHRIWIAAAGHIFMRGRIFEAPPRLLQRIKVAATGDRRETRIGREIRQSRAIGKARALPRIEREIFDPIAVGRPA